MTWKGKNVKETPLTLEQLFLLTEGENIIHLLDDCYADNNAHTPHLELCTYSGLEMREYEDDVSYDEEVEDNWDEETLCDLQEGRLVAAVRAGMSSQQKRYLTPLLELLKADTDEPVATLITKESMGYSWCQLVLHAFDGCDGEARTVSLSGPLTGPQLLAALQQQP